MQFIDIQNEVYRQTGLDSTNSNNQTAVQFWINLTQRDISGRWTWNWLKGREVLQTVTDYTTGTVSINSGSTTVTGVGTTFTSAMALGQYMIQFQGRNDWYKITAFGSATSLTIEATYDPSTNLSAGTYIIRKFFYSLSSSADRIYDIKNWNTPVKLVQVDAYTLDDRRPNPQSTASSSAYNMWGYDSSGNIVLQLYPFPNDIRNIEVRTWIRVTDLSASTDVTVIPSKWQHVLIYGSNALGFAYLRKYDAAKFWADAYEKKIEDMLVQGRTSEDDQPVLKAVDAVARGNFVRLPDSYPAIGPGGA